MKQSIKDDMRRVAATAVNRPLLAFWKARLDDLKNDLLHSSEINYREVKGRALEAEDFIKILESVQE